MNRRLLTAIVFLALWATVYFAPGAFACDFCLISQGISPLETINGAGIRVNERYTRVDKVYRGTEKITNPGAKEEFWNTEITGFFSLREDLLLMAVVPLKKNKMDGDLMVNPGGTVDLDPARGNETGLGDVSLIARYTFLRRHTLDSTFALAALAGVKFPTGKTDGRTESGNEFLDSHIQLGTGSTDYILGLSMNDSFGRATVSANALGTITTRGKAGESKHQFGDSLNYDVTGKYRVYPGAIGPQGPQFFLSLGVNGELRQRENLNGARVDNSGGHTVYVSPGAQLVLGSHWVIEAQFQQAVYHNLYGVQLGESYRTSAGVTFMF